MLDFYSFAQRFPSVVQPTQKLNFKEKMKWTGIILVLFFLLGSITVAGITPSAVAQFQFLEIVFGAKFGSIMTLGIGPIVTASIILQLLVGSKIINWNLQNSIDKAKFTSTQKILTVLFCFFEAAAYVLAGAIPPASSDIGIVLFVILQLAAGGILVMFMDEVVSKWGIGSGISLFIAAGVAKTIVLRLFNPLSADGGLPTPDNPSVGLIFSIFNTLAAGQLLQTLAVLLPIISTAIIFAIVIFAQGIHVEIPLAFTLPFGKFGARKWPLKFFYSSNIPVILTAALLANFQLMGKAINFPIFATYDESGQIIGGLLYFLTPPHSESIYFVVIFAGIFALLFSIYGSKLILKRRSIRMGILGAIFGLVLGLFISSSIGFSSISIIDLVRVFTYILVYIIGSTIFSIFWVNTAGMDAHSIAEQFKSYSIMIPGFRHDPRIIESILNRYIPSLTVLGGAAVGLLAAYADLCGAIGTGTGILLTVMIIYQFYEQLISQHSEDIPEKIKKFIGEV
ncbi:MAG: preprotein translocase subunit SecY [Candidatus Aenigmatarchaeota archaeon]